MSSRETQHKPFPGVNCQRMRNLKDAIKKLKDERTQMFTARDNAIESLHNCGEAETNKQLKCKGDWADACMAIERLKKQIKWCQDELLRTIESADQADLFDSADVEVPLFEDDAEDADPDDSKPVGEAQPETIEAYLPGRFRDQNGTELNINNMEHLQEYAAKLGGDISMVPWISKSFGCTVEFLEGKTSRGTLTYIGKARGRRAG